MVEIIRQETGTEVWNRMLEGNVKRVIRFEYTAGRGRRTIWRE